MFKHTNVEPVTLSLSDIHSTAPGTRGLEVNFPLKSRECHQAAISMLDQGKENPQTTQQFVGWSQSMNHPDQLGNLSQL